MLKCVVINLSPTCDVNTDGQARIIFAGKPIEEGAKLMGTGIVPKFSWDFGVDWNCAAQFADRRDC